MLCQLSYTQHRLESFPSPPAPPQSSARPLGAPEGIRTPDPRLRRPLLYPPELQARSGRADLNGRPPAPKAGALPSCATPRAISNNTPPWRPQPHIRHGDVATRSRDDSVPVDHGVRDRNRGANAPASRSCSGTRRCGMKTKIETADAMRSKLHCTPGLAPDPTHRKFQALKIKASAQRSRHHELRLASKDRRRMPESVLFQG